MRKCPSVRTETYAVRARFPFYSPFFLDMIITELNTYSLYDCAVLAGRLSHFLTRSEPLQQEKK